MAMKESLIDERYRLKLLEYYLDSVKEDPLYNGMPKWRFICPFCGGIGNTEAKRRKRRAVLVWDIRQHSWVFHCSYKRSSECFDGKNFSNLISALNPALGEAYRRERWHSGTTGKGHNCRAPQGIVGISTGSYGSMRSISRP